MVVTQTLKVWLPLGLIILPIM